MSVTQGTATIEEDALTLRFTVAGEELIHGHLLGNQDDSTFAFRNLQSAAVAYGAALLERIVVRGERGETIAGRMDVPNWEPATGAESITKGHLRKLHVGYAFSYPLFGKPGYVSLQQKTSPQLHSAPSQIVLAFRSDALPPQTIQLTGGGNVEIVRLIRSPRKEALGKAAALGGRGGLCDRSRFVLSEAQRTVRAFVQIDANSVRVDLYLPVRILETWIALPRAHRDHFGPDEHDRVLSEVGKFLVTRNHMYINGQLQQPRIDIMAFLDVGHCEPGDVQEPRRSSSWTSRVYASIQYPSNEGPREVDLQWNLFNSSILAAHTLVVADGDCREQDISTYQRHLVWRRE